MVEAAGGVNRFGARLRAAVRTHGPLCIGIDPHPALLTQWRLPDTPAGLERFALSAVEAFAGRVAVIKPQSAFFERHGSRGIAALEQTIAAARSGGAIVLLDAKRGDIGSTMEAYADAYLEPGRPLFADAITASPYPGFDALRPLLDAAVRNGAGVFVLAYTSNPGGAAVQRATDADGRRVADAILDRIAAENADAAPLGSVGAVIGATLDHLDYDIAAINGPVLAPGFGAQGGTADDLRRLFGRGICNVLPATSRDILRHGPDVAALRAAAERVSDAVRAVAA